MNAIDILIRMEEAARTLKRLPDPAKGPRQHATAWPEWLRDAHLAYGYESSERDLALKSRIMPTPEEIDRMDEAIPWLQLVETQEARWVWARANGEIWRRIARRIGVAPPTARKRVIAILDNMARQLRKSA